MTAGRPDAGSTPGDTPHGSTPGAAPHGSGSGTGPGPSKTGRQDPVLAAGCVLWRRPRNPGAGDHAMELCLVHRPKYDDWSHPKGKLKSGEDTLAGALREVLEETGHHCVPGTRLGTVRYLVGGRPKEVTYWAAEATVGAFAPNDEVDRIIWLPPAVARSRATQPRDRLLVTSLLRALHLN